MHPSPSRWAPWLLLVGDDALRSRVRFVLRGSSQGREERVECRPSLLHQRKENSGDRMTWQ